MRDQLMKARLPYLGLAIILILAVGSAEGQEEGAAGTDPASGTSAATPASDGTVTNVFFDTDLRQAFSDVSAQTGVMIIPTEDVRGTITMELKNMPFEKALRLMCLPGGYVYKQIEEGIWLVGSPAPDALAFRSLAETKLVDLGHLGGKEVYSRMPPMYEKYCKMDELGNQIVVTAPEPILTEVAALIGRLDQPLRQIMIEALVVETSAANLKEFAIQFSHHNWGVNTQSGIISYSGLAENLLGELLWLITNQKAVTKASPNIVAQEGRTAKVEVSTEQYFTVVTGPVTYPYTTLQQIDANVGLEITPTVAEATGEITVKLKPTVADAKGEGTNNLPIIIRRTVETQLRVKDGEVIAVGGLLQEIEDVAERKIPVLGDIPLIGKLFRSHDKNHQCREIVIFIVPHLLNEDGTFKGPRILDRVETTELLRRSEVPAANRQRAPQRDREDEAWRTGPARGATWW